MVMNRFACVVTIHEMTDSAQLSPGKKLIAWAVTAALLFSAPGFPCYQAIAATEVSRAPTVNETGAIGRGASQVGGLVSTPKLDFMGAANLDVSDHLSVTQGLKVDAQLPLALHESAIEVARNAATVERAAIGNVAVVPAQSPASARPEQERAAAALHQITTSIGDAGDTATTSERTGTNMWASLSSYWDKTKDRRADSVSVTGSAPGPTATRPPSLVRGAGAAVALAVPSVALVAQPINALTLPTVTNPAWLTSTTGVAMWLPVAAVALAAIIAIVSPKAQTGQQIYLEAELKPMSEIPRSTLTRLGREMDEDALEDHAALMSYIVQQLGYDDVYTTGGKYVLSMPAGKTADEATKELTALGIIKVVKPITVSRPERSIESRIAAIVPIGAATFASGMMLGSPWSGFFTAIVMSLLADRTSRYTKTLAAIAIPLLMTVPSAIIGFYTDSPFAAFFHSMVVGGMFTFLARGNTFGSYYSGKQLNFDRTSLLLTVGLPLAALSVFTIWIGWPLAGFIGLVALVYAIRSVLESSVGAPKP